MNKNTTTYNLNEDSLRDVLGQYEAGFDAHHWEEAERRLDSLGLQRKTVMSGKAKKLGLLASLVVVGGLLAAFINLNKKTVAGEENTQAFQATAPAEEVEILKIDSQVMPLSIERKSGIAEIVAPVTDTAKTPELAQQPENNTVNKTIQPAVQMKTEAPAVVAENNNTDTAVKAVDDQSARKKKKGRRKNADVLNTVTPPPVTHTHADDEVIITE